jgi:hypothetical protein
MKSYEVIGIEEVDYTSKRTNQQVHGRRLHLVSDFSENNTNAVGNCAEQVFTTCKSVTDVEVGDTIELYYNKYGSIEDLRIVNEK